MSEMIQPQKKVSGQHEIFWNLYLLSLPGILVHVRYVRRYCVPILRMSLDFIGLLMNMNYDAGSWSRDHSTCLGFLYWALKIRKIFNHYKKISRNYIESSIGAKSWNDKRGAESTDHHCFRSWAWHIHVPEFTATHMPCPSSPHPK